MALRRWLSAIIICLLIVMSLGYVKYTQVMAAIAFGESFPEPSETVVAQQVEWSQYQPEISVMGEIRATRTLTVRNELEGVITVVGFESGSKVNRGSLLLQLDVTDETAQLDAFNAQIELAKLDVVRLTKLAKTNASSQSQLDRARADLAINQARARSLQAVIAKKTLIAPFEGQTGLHQFEVGAFLSANSVVTTLIGDLSEVWLDFSIPQSYADLAPGTTVMVALQNHPEQLFEASIIATNQQIETVSRNIRVRALLANAQNRFKPGQSVSVFMPVDNAIPVVKLPSTAIRYDSFGSFVYQLTKDDNGQYRASRLPVVISGKDRLFSLVSSGLDEGNIIATKGSFKLREGSLVNIDPNSDIRE